MKAGASGYVTKETSADELIDAIRQVYSGGKFIKQLTVPASLKKCS
jgi:DNA-binding NarL/FixJ family response regulator